MKNLKKLNFSLLSLLFVALITFTSCEKESADSFDATETFSESRQPLAVDIGTTSKSSNTNLPQTIQELRDAGVPVSNGLASFVRTLENLLAAAAISVTDGGEQQLLAMSFFRSEVVELRTIHAGYQALLEDNNPDPDPTPGDFTPITRADLADIAETQGFQLTEEALSFGIGSTRELLLRPGFGPRIRFNDFWHIELSRARRGNQQALETVIRVRQDFANANGFTLTDVDIIN